MDNPEQISRLMINTLAQMGVKVVKIDIDSTTGDVTFYINVYESKLIQSLDDTLKSTYGILWTSTFGKITNDNRDRKIHLEYEVIKEDNNENN